MESPDNLTSKIDFLTGEHPRGDRVISLEQPRPKSNPTWSSG